MTEALLVDELKGPIQSRFLLGLLVEECFDELQPLLRNTVYHLYREFSRDVSREEGGLPPGRPYLVTENVGINGLKPMKTFLDLIDNNDEIIYLVDDEDEKVTGKLVDKTVQTYDIPLVTHEEENILRLIRMYNIRIDSIATLAYGMMYNYSNRRYTVATEEICLSSDDEDEVESNPGLKAGIEFSELNKQIMNLINTFTSQNVNLLLNKILRILIQDRNIIFSNAIISLIDNQSIDTNGNDLKKKKKKQSESPEKENDDQPPKIIQLTITVGVNTDLSGEVIKPPPVKRKVPKQKSDAVPVVTSRNKSSKDSSVPQVEHMQAQPQLHDKSLLYAQRGPELGQQPQLQFEQHQHMLQNQHPPAQPHAAQMTNNAPMSQLQSMNNMRPAFHQQFNNPYGNFHQLPAQAPQIPDHNGHNVVESPIALMNRYEKSPNTNLNQMPAKQMAPRKPSPVLPARLPNMQPQNLQATNQYPQQMPFVEQQARMATNPMQGVIGNPVSNPMPMPTNALAGYSSVPNLEPSTYALGPQAQPISYRRRGSMDSRMAAAHPRIDPLMQAATNPDSVTSAGNTQGMMNQPNQHFYGNYPMPNAVHVPTAVHQQRMQGLAGWDAQAHTYPKPGEYPQNTRMYDAYSRYQ